jgi:hypothetical protein
MKNHYLYINKKESGDIEINYSDGVFSGFATTSIEGFYVYCIEKAKEWSEQLYRNYDGWSDVDRMTIADKWLAAKELPEGKYEYYFNFGTIQDIFREEVAALAKSMGINKYNLTVE